MIRLRLRFIHGLLGRYHDAQSCRLMRSLMSSQLRIESICTSIWQINWLRIWLNVFELQLKWLWMNDVDGHFSTQTCGVLQPYNGTRGSMHFSRLKNSKYGLSITLLSTPHLRPFESAGTSRRSKSPLFIAAHDTRKTKKRQQQNIKVSIRLVRHIKMGEIKAHCNFPVHQVLTISCDETPGNTKNNENK